MSIPISIGDNFKTLFETSSIEGHTIYKESVLEITEIYPDKDSVRCLVKVLCFPDFYAEFGTYFLLKSCVPFNDCRNKADIATPKCDCGATKVYGENIGPEMHAHYCSLKLQ